MPKITDNVLRTAIIEGSLDVVKLLTKGNPRLQIRAKRIAKQQGKNKIYKYLHNITKTM